MTNPYSVLGVPHDASYDDIRLAYLRLARRVHPDMRGGDPASVEQMSRINRAWELLSDTEVRVAYDLHNQDIASDSRDNGAGIHSDTDDLPITAGRLPEWLLLGAPTSCISGVFVLILGFVVDIMPMTIFGLFMLIVSAVLFLLAPFAVLVSSRNTCPDRRMPTGAHHRSHPDRSEHRNACPDRRTPTGCWSDAHESPEQPMNRRSSP